MRTVLVLLLGLFAASATDVHAQPQGAVVVSPALARVTIPIWKSPTENWRWHLETIPVNQVEYIWSASIEGDTTFTFGFQMFRISGSVPQLGTFAELLRAGQSNLWIGIGHRDQVVRNVRPALRSENNSIVIELRDSSLIAMLFSRAPAQVTLVTQTPEQPLAQQKVTVQYEGFQQTVFAPAFAPLPPAKPKGPCRPEVVDTQQYGAGVYRDCDTDRPARLTHEEQPTFRFPEKVSCGIVELSLMVDSTGLVVPGTAALISTNEAEYAMLVVASLPKWRYEPAMLRGNPVAQLVMVRHARADGRIMVVRQGAPPPMDRRPPCK